jgi:hypothetical protein
MKKKMITIITAAKNKAKRIAKRRRLRSEAKRRNMLMKEPNKPCKSTIMTLQFQFKKGLLVDYDFEGISYAELRELNRAFNNEVQTRNQQKIND